MKRNYKTLLAFPCIYIQPKPTFFNATQTKITKFLRESFRNNGVKL